MYKPELTLELVSKYLTGMKQTLTMKFTQINHYAIRYLKNILSSHLFMWLMLQK